MLGRATVVVRSVLVIGGLAFAAIEVGAACLDHVGEDVGQCHGDGGTNCEAGAATTPSTGSGSGK